MKGYAINKTKYHRLPLNTKDSSSQMKLNPLLFPKQLDACKRKIYPTSIYGQ